MRGIHYRARLAPDFSVAGHRLYVMWDSGQGRFGAKVQVATGFTTIEHDEGDAFGLSDGIPCSGQLVQAILDEAWSHGFRPRGFSDVQNETAALREHLGDLRKIAFHQLKIK